MKLVFPHFLFHLFWSFAGSFSVRTKILGIVWGMVLLLGFAITLQVRLVMEKALVNRLQEQSISIAHDLASRSTDLILINDLYSLHQLLAETQFNNADVRYAFIVTKDNNVLVHTFGIGFPSEMLMANYVLPNEHHRTIALTTDEGVVWDTAVPIFEGQAGVARVGLSEQGIQTTLTTLTGQMLLTTIFVSAIGIAAAAFLTWIVTRPLLQLKEAAQAVEKGDFHQQIKPWSGDEIGDLTEAFNSMTKALTQAAQERAERDQLRTQLLEKVIAAQEEERRRISRELHDQTGQALTSLMVRLQMMSQQYDIPTMREQFEELRRLTSTTLEDVHHLSVQLRPRVLDDLGLEAALQRYVQEYNNRFPVAVDLAVVGINRMPPAVETALYRIVQEGLTNIARHAQARTASILVERCNGWVRVIVEDDGIGFDPQKVNDRLGLYGMKERAELLNGNFTVESSVGQGTSIFVEVPA